MSASAMTRFDTMGAVLEVGGAAIRPLRSTVSETVGCQSSEGAR